MTDKAAREYRNRYDTLIVLFGFVAVPSVLIITILVSDLVEGGWGIALTILAFLMSTGTALTIVESLQRKRSEGEYALRFPGYAGSRFPLFHLLRYEDGHGVFDFSEFETIYSIGEASESLFLLKNKSRDYSESMLPGKIVGHPKTFRPIVLHLPDIVDVAVIERSDEEIAESAVDHRDYGDRLASAIAQGVTGTRVKTKITPYAAYVAVTTRGADGEAFLLAAIPTDVTAEVLTAMGERTKADDFKTPWLIEKGLDQAKSAAIELADERATDLLGEPVMDVVHQGADLVEDALDVVNEAKSWIDPDAASVATTAGARGRRMAQLIGERIRRRAGLTLT